MRGRSLAMVLAALIAAAVACDSSLSPTFGTPTQTVSPTPQITPPLVWQSWDIEITTDTSTATVTSTDGRVAAAVLLYGTSSGTLAPTRVLTSSRASSSGQSYEDDQLARHWFAPPVNDARPRIGKSDLPRDPLEVNVPSPFGVYDLQLHPDYEALNGQILAVAAFEAPFSGAYEVGKIGARVVRDCSNGVAVIFWDPPATTMLASHTIPASNEAWFVIPEFTVTMTSGQHVFVAVSPNGSSETCDAVEVTFRVTWISQ